MIRSFFCFHRFWVYSCLFLLVIIFVILSNIQSSYSQSWLNLLFQGVQVIQLTTMSDFQEVKLAQQINDELIRSGQFHISQNPQLNQAIEHIGRRLAPTSERPNLPYTFQVVDDISINAFATMGGFVYINTGLMATAENEAELASVVAHEVAHITARHSIIQMRDIALSQGLMSAAGLRENTIVQLGVQLGLNLPHNRKSELEADRLGLINLRNAGYATIGMVTFMQKLMQQNGSSVPDFLSTHPATSDRLRALNQAVDDQRSYQGDGLDNQAYQQNIRRFL
ncbi:M48 family metallopeptidase [cyanobacterium endosymbiont of Epithemia turgida]|uniref:M48 family metallopeptidase n=1 Tax=cyanobacterium endosymbiont of Epithemia turgida TaxID=718217 RepID=UPI0004D11F05|nr:M48 family metallopeptidase [cyanobacterium endosymbiont of Epithemia turgida]BAP18233.1 peptidase M48 Ste24p [cyanobacterium endosymbiont of Epithemia turgida isolate EtSB Lake Yunoko]